MHWTCKICKFETSRRNELLKHYRLKHSHGGLFMPCLYWDCYCSFEHMLLIGTENTLLTHWMTSSLS